MVRYDWDESKLLSLVAYLDLTEILILRKNLLLLCILILRISFAYSPKCSDKLIIVSRPS